MIAFIVKSTVALCVFLAFYHLILEREKMHQFNRFFLLFAIVISFAIPFISFEIIKEIPVDFSRQVAISQHALNTSIHQTAEKVDYKFILLWTLYAIVTLLMAIRFGRNIWKIFSRIGNSPNVEFKNSKLVLVKEKIVPHTFLHYIFINLEDYKKQNIEAELYTHELVHVHQKHTLDILFIEFLKVVFWFNPIFLFYKKAIQLNHEFLADQEIVKTYNDVPFYQNLLLTKGSEKQTIYLASNLNYLVTKKRLIMMKKRTSKNTAFLKKIAVVPLVTILMLLLCMKTVAQEVKTEVKSSTSKNSSDEKTVVSKDKKQDVAVKEKSVKPTDKKKTKVSSQPAVASKKTQDVKENEALNKKQESGSEVSAIISESEGRVKERRKSYGYQDIKFDTTMFRRPQNP
ncbi:M56 family metallopeptidase [Flavobacterium sp. IB48]|uniref:M56 family metallopeptidase n=1 Tax=Flavobacterium sp. IB48 TaxID=2779375 RepID=UPI0018E8DA2E|nr:M56 family metallopeptidase [Flavobacterium sp. IB48]MBJ2123202.1 regulatory sensor-transducer, BlaR1/MecR1 family protein [Flavobacterium sp. IB48]